MNAIKKLNYQGLMASVKGVDDTMFNPYDVERCVSYKGSDFIGILRTEYFLNYYAFLAGFYSIGEDICNAMVKYEQHDQLDLL